jgi:hypothetical protein
MVRPADENDQDIMLGEALAKARKLVAEMEKQKAEIAASPPEIPPDKLAEGKQAFDNALASARRMLKALEDAAACAHDDDAL